MLQEMQTSRRNQNHKTTMLKKQDLSLRSNSAWRGSLSILEGEELLKGASHFTYCISEGLDRYHYILHYVGVDNRVHFKNIRSLIVDDIPVYRNGGNGTYENIGELVSGCLRCSPDVCSPLV